MFKKLLSLSLVMLFTVALFNTVLAQNRRLVTYKWIEDALVGNTGNNNNRYVGPVITFNDAPLITPVHLSDVVAITQSRELDTNGRTIYDLESNGVIRFIQQDPNQPRNIHAVFMCDRIGATGYPDRRTKYFFSNDTGNTFTYLGEVPNVRSGFPSLGIIKNTTTQWLPVIVNHSNAGTNTGVRTQAFVDIAPGIGGFVALDPNGTGDPADQPIWPSVAGTTDNTATVKFNFVGSKNAGDTTFRNRGTSISTSTFAGYTPMLQLANAQSYSVARDGNNVLIAGVNGDLNPGDAGDVWVFQSTDAGVTFGAPTKIWDCNFATDSIGGIRSIDAIYYNGSPRVFMGLAKVTETGFFPGLASSQRVWGPNINGGVPVTVDSRPGMNGSNTTNDVFVSCCRGVLGRSADGVALYAAWNVARSDTSDLGNNFFDVYFAYSTTGGATWTTPLQVTNLPTTPLRDCRYVAISTSNNYATVGNRHQVYLTHLQDSVAASSVNGAPPSVAKMWYRRITIDDPIGIHNIGSEIPGTYSLNQNYPNPFNPTTNIRFALPKNGNVTLKIYDVLGREVTTLLNNSYQTAGVKEIDFNATGIASGIYFYTLTAGDFKDTKKMILAK